MTPIYTASSEILILCQDYSNPLTSPLLVRYPHHTDGPISELWHGNKLNSEVPLDHLCPHFIDARGHYFYVNEFARLHNGQYIIPKRWRIHDDGEVWADAYLVSYSEAKQGHVVEDQSMHFIMAADLRDNYYTLIEENQLPQYDGEHNHLGIG